MRSLFVVGASTSLAFAMAACSSDSATSASDGGPQAPVVPMAAPPFAGCTTRSAVAHHPGAITIDPAPAGAPYSCAVPTGYPAVDPGLVFSGSVMLFAPVAPAAILSTSDNATTWDGPSYASTTTTASLHPWLYRDAPSGRVFFNRFATTGVPSCPDSSGTTVWTSDDVGQTWTSHDVGCGSKDYGKIITGPPATAARRAALAAAGVVNMVYFCATGPTFLSGPDRMCYRSVDGGETFERTGADAIDAAAGQHGFPNGGSVGPDGSIYVAHPSSTGLAISISHDEGDSWADSFVPGSTTVGMTIDWLSTNVTTDSAGNVYATWVDDSDYLPYLSISRDGGVTFGQGVMIGTPGIAFGAYPSITAKEPGYVAIAYYGTNDADLHGGDAYFRNDGRAYDAYLAVIPDAFDADPVVWTAQVNEPGAPVISGLSYVVSEYLGPPAFGPDGSVWAAFVNQGQGLAARLTPPP
jgi:hypothetical protein